MTTTQSILKCAACGHENALDAHFCKNCGAPLGKGDPSDPLVNRIVGSYRLLSRIGEGGFGVVYKASHVKLETTFAIKILHPQFSANEQVAERFRREALAAGKLRHEHVVSIADFGHTAGVGFYYAMEYLQGRSLKSVMDAEGSLPVERILHIAQQVTSAMQRVHEQKILHRDLKPDNIFLIEKDGTSDYVKLVDFGIAKILGEEEGAAITKTGLSVGTPLYMSPEQARGQLRNLDYRTDIYSWSVILFEMLSGRVPFFSEAPHEVLLMHIKGRPPRLSDVDKERMYSPELEGLFRRLLSKNPTERPDSMVELYRVLEKELRVPNAILDLRTQPESSSFASVQDLEQVSTTNTPVQISSASAEIQSANPASTTSEVNTDLSMSVFDSGDFSSLETPEPTLLPQVLRAEEGQEESPSRGFRLRGSPELRRIGRFAAARKKQQDEEEAPTQDKFGEAEDTHSGTPSPFQDLPLEEHGEEQDNEPTANVSRDELLASHQKSLEEESPSGDEDTLSTTLAAVEEAQDEDNAAEETYLDEQEELTVSSVREPGPRVIPTYKPWYMKFPMAARVGIPAALVLGLVLLIVLLQWQHERKLTQERQAKANLPPGHLYAPKKRAKRIVVVKKKPARAIPAPRVRALPNLRPLPQQRPTRLLPAVRRAPATPQKALQKDSRPLKTGQPVMSYVTLTVQSTSGATVYAGKTKLGSVPRKLRLLKGKKQRLRVVKKGYRTRTYWWWARANRVVKLPLRRVVVTKKVTPRNHAQPKPPKRRNIFHNAFNPFKKN